MPTQLYVYGIVDSAAPVPDGMERVVHRGVAALVGVFERPDDLPGHLQDIALAHERVVEAAMARATVLPMRLLTVLGGQEQVVAMLRERHDVFKDNLSRLAGKVEFGLKALWPAAEIKARLRLEAEDVAEPSASPARLFMLEKLQAHRLDNAFRQLAEARVKEIDAFLADLAVERKLRTLQTEKLLLNASYLVGGGRRPLVAAAFQKLKGAVPDCEFLFSGPWPPYNFIDMPQDRVELLGQVLKV